MSVMCTLIVGTETPSKTSHYMCGLWKKFKWRNSIFLLSIVRPWRADQRHIPSETFPYTNEGWRKRTVFESNQNFINIKPLAYSDSFPWILDTFQPNQDSFILSTKLVCSCSNWYLLIQKLAVSETWHYHALMSNNWSLIPVTRRKQKEQRNRVPSTQTIQSVITHANENPITCLAHLKHVWFVRESDISETAGSTEELSKRSDALTLFRMIFAGWDEIAMWVTLLACHGEGWSTMWDVLSFISSPLASSSGEQSFWP